MIKKILSIILIISNMLLCANEQYKIDEQLVNIALNKAQHRAKIWQDFINQMPSNEKKEAAKFLVAFMPERDLLLLDTKIVANNIEFAFLAREKFAWAKKVPQNIFFNDVLPYFLLNETRENWRPHFFKIFSPLVAKAKNIEEAAIIINNKIAELLKVKYSVLRKKADQSCLESMQSGLASCSGLSILLSNAFRSVGIPSRIAGITFWANKGGNHNWNELWFDNQWHFTEYYPDKNGFNHSWFIEDCAYADSQNWKHTIYASSFAPQSIHFPLIWDLNLRWVAAVNRTEVYKKMGLKLIAEKKDCQLVAFVGYNLRKNQRDALKISIIKNNQIVFSSFTKNALADMNNMLTFTLKLNEKYTVKYFVDGKEKSRELLFTEKQQTTHIITLNF